MKLIVVLSHETLVAVGIDEWIWFVTAGESLAFFKKNKK